MKTFAEKAYSTTAVDSDITQGRIQMMLEDLNINESRFTKVGDDYILEFIMRLDEHGEARKVKINIPIETDSSLSMQETKQLKNKAFRVLYYNLKNKFVSITNSLKTIEEEFLADLCITVDGKEMRIGDIILPQYKKSLEQGKVKMIKE